MKDFVIQHTKALFLAIAIGICLVGFYFKSLSANVKPEILPPLMSLVELKDYAQELAEDNDAPGVVFSHFKEQSETQTTIYTFGHADDEGLNELSSDTRFRIGSLSTGFVGALTLMLVDEGLINLDDPLSKYLSEVPNASVITIRAIAFNKSGVSDIHQKQIFQQAVQDDPTKTWTADEFLPFYKDTTLSFIPGSDWRYSSTNTLYLAAVISSVLDMDIEAAMDKYLIAPLELTNTGFDSTNASLSLYPSGYSFAHPKFLFKAGPKWTNLSHWNASWAGAYGGMYSNASDLLRFTHALFSGNLLSPEMQSELLDWQKTSRNYWQYGLQVWEYKGAYVLAGDIHGFSAFSTFVPEYEFTFTVLANLRNERTGKVPAVDIGTSIVERIYGMR